MAEDLKPIISYEEYSLLDNEDKAKYKVYVPSANSDVQAQLDLANTQAKALSKLEPLQKKIAGMPVDLPGKQLAEATEILETAIKLIDPIKALMGVPIIGQLVAPLVNFLNNLIKMLGSLLYICNCIMLGKEMFTDSYIKVIDGVDWEGLEQVKKDIEEKKKAAEKAKKEKEEEEAKLSEEQKKKAEDERRTKSEEEKKKLEEAVKKELGKDYENLTSQVTKMYDNMEMAIAYAKIVKATKVALQQYSFSEGTIKQSLVKVLNSCGIDTSPLEQMTSEQKKAFAKNFPDPTEEINKINDAIKTMNNKTRYILIQEVKPAPAPVVKKEKKVEKNNNQLSEHFTLSELCYSKVANELNIKNNPGDNEIENLRLLCQNILEPIYKKYGKPTITSGYRCPKLNVLVGGSSNSEHQYGMAVDIVVPSLTVEQLATWISVNCKYRQLIIERNKNSKWVHVSYNCSNNKCQNLTINNNVALNGLLSKDNTKLV